MAAVEKQMCLGYEIGEMLGFGAFSFARKGRHPETGQEVALKFTKYAEGSSRHIQQQIEEIQKELTILKGITHPNILNLLNFSQEEDYTTGNGQVIRTYCMALELCDGGELFDILYYTGPFEEKLARTFFRQIISGLKACHDENVAHRDIKAQNVLLGENFVVKLADFGSSKIWTDGELMRTSRVGTKGYQAPELILQRGYTSKSDIFSCGVLLFIMLTRKPPFQEAKASDRFFRSLAKNRHDDFYTKHGNPNISSACKDLLNGMLTYQPLQRLDLEAVQNSEWYNMDVYAQADIGNHMATLCRRAHNARAKDKSRNYSNYNSLKGVANNKARDTAPPPEIPAILKYIAFEVPEHPMLYINNLQIPVQNMNGISIVSDDKNAGVFKFEMVVDSTDEAGKPIQVNVPVQVQINGYIDSSTQKYYLHLKRAYEQDPESVYDIHVDLYATVFDEIAALLRDHILARGTEDDEEGNAEEEVIATN